MNPTGIIESLNKFQKAVNGLAARPKFMAYLFSLVFDGDISAKRISAELGCSEANALRLAMMCVPRSDRQLFRDDLSRIAEAAGADRARLLAVVKQALALAAFDVEDKGQGMLLAARDVVGDPDDREG